jgi:hypothetical protein
MLGDAAGCCIPIFLLHGREHGTTRKVRNTDTTVPVSRWFPCELRNPGRALDRAKFLYELRNTQVLGDRAFAVKPLF